MRKILSLLVSSALLATFLITLAPSSQASPPSTLITCTNPTSNLQIALKENQPHCALGQLEAIWHIVQGDTALATGSGQSSLHLCTSKSAFSYQYIRATCPRYQVGTNYYRALTTPLTPVILAGIALGYDAARLTLAAPTPSDAPIAYYMVANLTTGLTTKVVAYPSTTLSVMGLQPQTSYSFQVSAVSIDGSSSTSLISPTITTGARPVVVVAPAAAPLAAPAFTLSSSSETRTVNTAATGFTINSTGGAIASFAINATPPGMSFSTSTGALTGTPTSVAGATAYTITATNATGSATATFTLTVIAVPIVISVAAIAGVTAPVTGATPVSTTTAGTGYTGTVTWSGSPATFAASTTYTATITLTATSGYTLTGVSANFFTVAGATAVTNLANAGVITAAFPATAVVPAAVAITRASVGTARRTAFTTQPQITIQDSGGNTVTSSSAVVAATVSAGGTLVGTTTATASSGVATFTDLGVDGTIGATYTITYTVSGLTIATATVTLSGTTCDGSFTCQVGDTGPGGGKIFYVASTFFTQVGATGSMCTTTCKYLEAAPNTWSGGSTDPAITWSTGSNQTSAVTGADGTVIGTGYQNSLDIVDQTGNLAASSAAVAARAYTGGSKNDWFLPSKDELAQLYAQKTSVGGFEVGGYWSSSEGDAVGVWTQDFGSGFQVGDFKGIPDYVRPVRAF